MNKKGQVLVSFIIVLPILLLLLGFIIEISLIEYNKIKITSLTKSIIASTIDTSGKDDIIKLYKLNNIEKVSVSIINNNGELNLIVNTKIDSFLGNIIGKKKYTIRVNIIGYYKKNKLEYKKG